MRVYFPSRDRETIYHSNCAFYAASPGWLQDPHPLSVRQPDPYPRVPDPERSRDRGTKELFLLGVSLQKLIKIRTSEKGRKEKGEKGPFVLSRRSSWAITSSSLLTLSLDRPRPIAPSFAAFGRGGRWRARSRSVKIDWICIGLSLFGREKRFGGEWNGCIQLLGPPLLTFRTRDKIDSNTEHMKCKLMNLQPHLTVNLNSIEIEKLPFVF